jgi:hypothetical protein
LIADGERVFSNLEVNMFDFGGFFQNDTAGCIDAVATDVGFVGEENGGVNDVVYLSSAAMIGDGMTDNCYVDVAERMVVAVAGCEKCFGDLGAIFSMVFFAANEATIMQ